MGYSLKTNRRGRLVFLAWTLLQVPLLIVFLLLALGPYDYFGVSQNLWRVNLFFSMSSVLIMLMLLLVTFIKKIYRYRFWVILFIYAFLITFISIHISKIHGWTTSKYIPGCDAGKAYFIAFGFMLAHSFLSTILLSFFASTRIAKWLHPFMERKPIGSGNSKSVSSVHRVPGGLFEDWPDPEPFIAEALYAYRRASESELSFQRGELLIILDCRGNWWQARLPGNGAVGFVPSNFVRVLQRATVVASYSARHSDEVSLHYADNLALGSSEINIEVEVMEVHPQMSLVRLPEGRVGSVPTSAIALLPIPPAAAALLKELD